MKQGHWMSRTLACALFAICVLVGSAELEADAAEAPVVPASPPSRFVVALYGACSDLTASADRVLMPSIQDDVEVTCIDAGKPVVGIEPEFVRVMSPDGYAGELLVRCEHPAPPRWREALSRGSPIALVAQGRVLSKYLANGDPDRDRCGVFTAQDTVEAVAMCRRMMRAWKKEPSACRWSCASALPQTTTCVER